MLKRIDPRQLTWVCQPKLYILSSDKLLIETEPFTELKPQGNSAEAVEMSIMPKGSFCFSARVDFNYHNSFDQCGFILYEGENRKMVIGTEYHNDEKMKLRCIVYHGGAGDISVRDVGSAITRMKLPNVYSHLHMRPELRALQNDITPIATRIEV